METTPQQQRNLAIGALIVLVLVVIAAFYVHRRWMKKNCACAPRGGNKFHGWRYQHYDDNPYNGQHYHCGVGAGGVHYPRQSPRPVPPQDDAQRTEEGFTADVEHWPTSGTFGNLADTNPYGNYAEGLQMYYPSYEEDNVYWTRS